MRIFREPTWADLRASGALLLWLLFYLAVGVVMWRGMALLFPLWLAVPLLPCCLWAFFTQVQDARRRHARRRR